MRRHADDLAQLIHERDLGPIVVAGYSMGAWAATTMATIYPDLTEGVVAIDGGLRIEYPARLSDSEAVEQVVGGSVTALTLEFESESAYLDNWRNHPAINPYVEAIDLTPLNYSLGGKAPHLVVRASGEAVSQDGAEFLVDEDVVTAAQRIECPLTLITVSNGMADETGGFMSAASVEEAIDANPRIRVRHLDGLNHYTLMLTSAAQAVADEIAAMTTLGQNLT
jgi:pimeloyl-ACP methyl ester carboxylesterase